MNDYLKNCIKYFTKYCRLFKAFQSTSNDEAEGHSQIRLYISEEFHVALEFIKREEIPFLLI